MRYFSYIPEEIKIHTYQTLHSISSELIIEYNMMKTELLLSRIYSLMGEKFKTLFLLILFLIQRQPFSVTHCL